MSDTADQIASAQTGPIVMMKGRIVSLAEFELRSKAWKTSTLPKTRTANAAATPIAVPILIQLMNWE